LNYSEKLLENLLGLQLDRLAVSQSRKGDDAMSQALQKCSMCGMRGENVGDLFEDIFHRVSLETVTLNQLVFSPAFRTKGWVVFCQTIYGRLLALFGIFVTWPIMLVTAIAVKLDSEGPALLRQVRLGQGGERFEFLKFRSMY